MDVATAAGSARTDETLIYDVKSVRTRGSGDDASAISRYAAGFVSTITSYGPIISDPDRLSIPTLQPKTFQ